MACFQNLCSTLDDMFAATVQSEEELSYSSATLILAGLLQIHARTPKYASHRARLESFPNRTNIGDSPHSSPTHLSTTPVPSPAELASAGFFHTGSGDETVCPACGLGLRDWQASDQPEACHVAYSTAATAALEMSSSEKLDRTPTPALPCLYLAVRRLLVSELPLARKSLVPVGQSQTVRGLPGVVSRPTVHLSGSDSNLEYPSLADRLRAIAQIMAAPPAPQGWPVENARALGHSDDLIVLALWCLQSEAAGMGLACPSMKAIHLDPQATTDLLKAILRVQEGLDAFLGDNLEFNVDDFNDDGPHSVDDRTSESSDGEMTAEDAETAALSRCRCQRLSPHQATDSASLRSVDSYGLRIKQVRLPRFYQFIVWWYNRYSADMNLSSK